MPGWLEHYLIYHSIRTDADPNFAKIEGCQLLGHMLGRKSVNLIEPDAVYHNSYVGLVGESTITRKSTSQRIGKEVFPNTFCHPDESSPEQFLVELSQHPNFFNWYGEFTYLLKGINSNNWMGRMAEIMNHIFDCPNSYTKTLRDNKGVPVRFNVNQPYLSFNTTCTPDMMEKYLDKELLVGGFLARFLLVEGKSNTRPRGRLDPKFKLYKERLNTMLMQLHRLSSGGVTFELDDDALKRYNEIEKFLLKKEKILPFVGRYLNYIISFADILLVSDALGEYMQEPYDENVKEIVKLDKLEKLGYIYLKYKPNIVSKNNISNSAHPGNINIKKLSKFSTVQVTRDYVDRAYEIIKPCFEYVAKLVNYVDTWQPYAKVKKEIDKHPIIDHSSLQRLVHLKPIDIQNAIGMLEEEHYIRREVTQAPGRKAKSVYHKL